MQITLIRNCLINSEHHDAGETLDVVDDLGKALVAMRRAVEGWPVVDDSQNVPTQSSLVIEPVIEPVVVPEVAAVEPAEEQAVVPMAKAKK